jgi:hypothetical protein
VKRPSIVYEHTSTICTHRPSFISILHSSSSLQLADEEAGREQAHALGQDVFGHDVDERRQQDKSDRGLVDEEEGDELGHGRLEDSLSYRVSLDSRTST